MNVNTLLEGASPLKHQQAESAKLAAKWEKSGLLEGLNGHESEKANMAVLLENQARQLVNEANQTSAGQSVTNGANSEAWAGVALPLVRRVFGEIVAKDLVSVQPMNLPSGLIFYLDFQYGTNQPGDSTNRLQTSGDSLYGAAANLKTNTVPTSGQPGSGLYGAGRFGYSINEFKQEFNYADAIATDKFATASVDLSTANGLATINYNAEFSASVATAGSTLETVRVLVADLDDVDLEGIRAFTLSGSGATSGINTVYNEFTKLVTTTTTNDTIEFVVSSSAGLGGNVTASVLYQKGPDNLDDRGDFEEGQTGVSSGFAGAGQVSTMDIPEINVQLRSETVTAKTRKLKAQWTPEFAQDLNAYHSIDAEAELTSILSEYISMEIDLELLDLLIRNADTTNHWSALVGQERNADGSTAVGSDQYYTKMSWFQTLGIKLQSVSNTIHQKTLRGGANFLVVSPKVSTILESIPGFAADSPGDSNKYAMGVQKIGAINSRYTVYKNPYMTENVILMGYKGNQFLETGAVFAPYIPLIMTPLVYDPVSFTPRKGIMTRYAKKMVRPDFYGKIFIHDLDNV
jgi:hypothetical protein